MHKRMASFTLAGRSLSTYCTDMDFVTTTDRQRQKLCGRRLGAVRVQAEVPPAAANAVASRPCIAGGALGEPAATDNRICVI